MKSRTINIRVEDYISADDLEAGDRILLEKAIDASATAYAPYSSFHVGAALRLAGGEFIQASNQENAAYPSGLCAERIALFYAQSKFPDVAVEAIAIYAGSSEFRMEQPVTPCGSCRQVMAEHENRHGKKIRIIMGGDHGKIQVVNGIESLLPLMFMLDKLKKY